MSACRLYPRSRFVLELLCRSDGVVSRWDLVDALSPGADDDGLVRFYVHNLRSILGRDAIERVRGVGYLACAKARKALATLEAA